MHNSLLPSYFCIVSVVFVSSVKRHQHNKAGTELISMLSNEPCIVHVYLYQDLNLAISVDVKTSWPFQVYIEK